MSQDDRDNMEKNIRSLIDISTDDVVKGQLYVIYETLAGFRWLFGNHDGEKNRVIKHWKLVIEIGFDSFILEFLENSLTSRHGLIKVRKYNPQFDPEKKYFLGNINISTQELYTHILELFFNWREYNVAFCNCQHFVQRFVNHYQNKGCMSNQTPHFWLICRENFVTFVRGRILALAFHSFGTSSKSIK
ncbi:hypothetical protein BGW39_002344 [Mortierella sp. 14UC]|nr:hypothetical protein BGW39_002344 [Mortierella sp. 14UC]